MKKNILLLLVLIIVIVTGCELNNNPTSKVEELLGKYQRLDNEITINYTDLSNETNLTTEQQERYNKLIKKQYRDLTYTIKDEKIDGDNSIITAEVKVKNYKDVIDKIIKENYSLEEYHNQILESLEKSKDKVTYTIDFDVTKENKEWKVNNLTIEQQQKILGIY